MEKVILHEKGLGYYGGQNKKYGDLFNLTSKDCAKELDKEDALKVKDGLNKVGYKFEIEEIVAS